MGNDDDVYRCTNTNWSTFKELMKGVLEEKRLGHTIEAGAQVNAEDSRAARGTIVRRLTPQTVKLVRGTNTALAAWQALENNFAANTRARKNELFTTVNSMEMGTTEGLHEYLGRAKMLRDQLEEVNAGLPEDMIVTSVLKGLTSQYDTVATILLNDNTINTVEDAQSRLISNSTIVEAQQKRAESGTTGSGMMGVGGRNGGRTARGRYDGRGPPNRRCYNCGKYGHIARNCTEPINEEEDDSAGGAGGDEPPANARYASGY